MAVQPDASSSPTDDIVLSVQLHQMRVAYPETVAAVARRWVDGLRGLLALAATVGVIGAPLGADRLGATTRIVVGAQMLAVLVVGTGGLLAAMTSAYGSLQSSQRPNSLTDFEKFRQTSGDRYLKLVVWGRRLAVGALALLAAAVAIAWLDPWADGTPTATIETVDGATFCGTVADGPVGHITVVVSGEGRVDIPAASLESVDISGKGCDG